MKQEILFQLDIAWQLFQYHCNGLSEAEAMWCKTKYGLQIRGTGNEWKIDWPETETYSIGPSSIAWTMWHILYWWKTTLSASKENRIIKKEDIKWPFEGQNMYSLALWLNAEFMKNVAEIGAGRFLYAAIES